MNNIINPHTGLKIAKPCYYDRISTARTDMIVPAPCEKVSWDATPMKKSYQPEQEFTRKSIQLNPFEVVLACIVIPLSIIFYVLYWFVWPVVKTIYYIFIIALLVKR